MKLTPKENALLKDMQDGEKLCADKYTRGAACACDPQLKNLFSSLAQAELGHLQTLNTIASGTVPQPSGGSGGEEPTFSAYHTADTREKKDDAYLCTDVLAAEKHASHLYDTCIFEFRNTDVRNLLNGIQKQEQVHGKTIFDYMSANGMY